MKKNTTGNTNVHNRSRFAKIVLSLGTSTLLKVLTFICSFLLTRLIIRNYGSEINGMLNSIVQFLGFIALLEGGIGGVARAVLFKPLAQKDNESIKRIITYLERFFRILALIFIGYSVVVACIFPVFANDYDYLFTFFLVLIVAISSFCEYFFGLSYTILLAADQKAYLTNTFSFLITLLNFVACVILIKLGQQIHVVKIVSSAILISKPIFLSIYCKIKYKLKKVKLQKKENLIPQKWSGLGVHIAYYLHRNTDIFLITVFLSLSMVSIYSVYNMIISGILTLAGSLAVGFEAALGNMYSNGEIDNLKEKFKSYVFYYQFICTILLSSTLVLIIPFVKIYTHGITDANYYQPLFAVLFVFAEFIYCLRVPFNDLMVASNSFKEIRWGAYLEAIINIFVSVSLIFFLGLSGVVIGTICAMVFRLIHFIWFFNKKKIHIEMRWFIKYSLVSFGSLIICYGVSYLLNVEAGSSFLTWIKYAVIVTITNTLFITLINALFHPKDFISMKSYLFKKIRITK